MKRNIYILLLLAIVSIARAQQLPLDNQYMINTYSLNPAFAGENGNMEAFLGYRASWLGVDGAPTYANINLNGSLFGNMGFGVAVGSEAAGSFEHFYANVAYSYHMQLGDEMWASLGLEGAFYRNQLDNSMVVSDGYDPLLANVAALNGTTYDAGAGLGFWAKGFTFGASVRRILAGKINYGGEEQQFFYKTEMEIDGFLSYMMAFGEPRKGRRRGSKNDNAPPFRVEPQFVLRYTASDMIYDAAVNVYFRDRFWVGGLFRKGGTVGLTVGGALQERIIMNYTYDMGVGDNIASHSSGSHAISIGFLLKAKEKSRYNRGRTLFLLEEAPVSVVGKNATVEGKDERVDKVLKDMALTSDSLSNYKKITDERIAKLENALKDMVKENQRLEDASVANDYEPPFVIENIKFGNNSDRLFPSSFPELNKLAKKMQDTPALEIKITGYTDNVGSPQYNQRLSERRAVSVANYLISRGIAAARIKTFGKGQEDPRADNNTKEGKEINRRIEGAFKKSR